MSIGARLDPVSVHETQRRGPGGSIVVEVRADGAALDLTRLQALELLDLLADLALRWR